MALQDISLPVDVAWTLLSTSDDMLATHDARFPHAMWKSSVAVFKFDPDPADLPDVQEYKDRALTFLKVVCSITSYAPPCDVCPPPPAYREPQAEFDTSWQDEYDAWLVSDQLCQALLHRSYPCSGALLQVAVYPEGKDTNDVSKLAYFAAFEPQKRELIEVATESGESTTQSKSDINIRKGVTSTDSTEDLDVFTGANLNVGVSGVSVGAGVSGQWGTIKRSGSQHDDVTTSDAARERREGSSHTTSVSQLYHLLNSYHLGTNRSIFFLQSRPHTLQQKDRYTFIDGPQEIEGIQEFFLVVSRPKDQPIENYCVDALLYTGHLDPEAMLNAIMEPKTAETQWIDLWATSPELAHGGGGPSWWQFLVPIPIPGVNDPVALLQVAAQDVQAAADALQKWWDDQVGNQANAVKFVRPAMLDGYLTPAALNNPQMNSLNTALAPPVGIENGWKIDRTRGLGGYDLWEDPNNRSADVLGRHDGAKPPPPPEAFVDIISSGSPDDLVNYHPDYALRVRAYAWPWAADDGQAIYHGRLKAYFIRNDLPTSQRTIDMFVTVRGTSTCADSPFFDYNPDQSLVIPPSIIAETKIHPPSIAPWQRTIDAASPTGLLPNGGASGTAPSSDATSAPINSARPSGLDPVALGAARAKMANSIGNLVRTNLVSTLRCLPERKTYPRYDMSETDLFFNRMSRARLKLEIGRLVGSPKPDQGLVTYVMSHPARAFVLGPSGSATSALAEPRSVTTAKSTAGVRRASAPANRTAGSSATRTAVAHSKAFPFLTLAQGDLTKADRSILEKKGIRSGLDLVNLSASDLARRLGVDVSEARALRLRSLGL